MSEHFSDNAKDITAIAADWLQRREFWNWSEEDQAALNAWLDQSLAHRIAYTRLQSAWSRTARVAALKSPTRKPVATHRPQSKTLLRFAAAFAVVAAIGAAATTYFQAPKETTYATAIGEHKIITLADGSRIELNTQTILRARLDADRRHVTLVKGEAFFNIKHDATHPFSVIAQGHRITDLGTKFLVSAQSNRLEVALMEGKAAFDAADGRMKSPIVLAPGDALVVADNQIHAIRRSTQSLANELGWRRGMLIFDNATLGQVAAELNRYNTRKLAIADPRTSAIRISASFRTTGTEDFAQLAHVLLGLKVESRNGETVISR